MADKENDKILIVEDDHNVRRFVVINLEGKFSIRAKKKYNDELGKLADTLNFMASEIVKNDQLKTDFISSISHELRTPLTSIKGWIVTLRNGKSHDDQEIQEGLEIVEKETDRLTYLLEELLDFSKFETDRMTLNIAPVNIKGLLHHINKQMAPRALRQRIKFDV